MSTACLQTSLHSVTISSLIHTEGIGGGGGGGGGGTVHVLGVKGRDS